MKQNRNSKILLVICAIGFNTLATYGQKLHAFLFCKTSDKTIGNAVRINYINIRERFQLIANALNYDYIEHPLTGLQFNVEKINSTLNNAAIDQRDIVLLYFSTHGAISTGDTAQFPQVKIREEYISAYDHHQLLLNKKPKFLMTVIEACSGYKDLTPQQTFLVAQFDSSQAVEQLSDIQVNNITKLFSRSCDLIITAGNPGKNTWATPDGSLFTNSFLKAMFEYFNLPDNQAAKINWNDLLDQTSSYTRDITSQTSITYHPVWEIYDCAETNAYKRVKTSAPESRNMTFTVETKRRLFHGGLPFNVRLQVINNSGILIDSVVYFLHKTMENPVVTRTNHARNFLLSMNVWGEFPVKAKVYFADGKIVELYQNFNLETRKREK